MWASGFHALIWSFEHVLLRVYVFSILFLKGIKQKFLYYNSQKLNFTDLSLFQKNHLTAKTQVNIRKLSTVFNMHLVFEYHTSKVGYKQKTNT